MTNYKKKKKVSNEGRNGNSSKKGTNAQHCNLAKKDYHLDIKSLDFFPRGSINNIFIPCVKQRSSSRFPKPNKKLSCKDRYLCALT